MVGLDPLSWLLAPAILQGLTRALAWMAERAAGALVDEGAKAAARQIVARLRGDEAQAQFQAAWEQAVAALRREERFYEVADPLLQNSSLILEEAAKVAAFGAQPDLDRVLRWSLGLPSEKRDLAREALEFFFDRLREALYDQSEFRDIWQLWEARLTREGVEKLVGELSLVREHLADLARAALDARRGLYVRPAAPLPDPLQVELYLEEVATRPVFDLEGRELAYVPREARERRPELFPRRVTSYRRPVSGTEVGGPGFAEPIESVLARQRRLVLLGDPGAGKTTTLRHLAREAAEKALAGSGPFPIYVELKRYGGQADLAPLLAQAVNEALAAHRLPLSADPEEAARMVRAWLGQGEFLLLLDGLNEVHPDYRTAAVAALKGLLAGPHQVVVSCRERDYSAELQALAPAYTLQPLSEEEIRNYLERDLGEQGEALFMQIRWDRRLLDLAGNPLMLWLMARVAEAEPEGRLPANKGQLLARFVAVIPGLRRREAVPLPDIPDDDVRAALRSLGLAMQERGRLEASLSEARAWTAWPGPHDLDLVLRAAKGLRFLKSDGRWGEPVAFLHPLFQEYFAADELRAWLEQRRDYDDILDYVLDEKWYEVFLMLAGIYDRPDELAVAIAGDGMPSYRAVLAWNCLQNSDKAREQSACNALIQPLISAMRTDVAAVKVHWGIIAALREIGASAVDPLINSLKDADWGVRAFAAWTLGTIGDSRAAEPLRELLKDEDEIVRMAAAFGLSLLGDADALQTFISILAETEQRSWLEEEFTSKRKLTPLEKEAASLVFAGLGLGIPWEKAAALLRRLDVDSAIAALQDTDPLVRWIAIQALEWLGDSRALPHLEKLAREDTGRTLWGSVADAAREAAERIRRRMGRSTEG